MTLPQMPPLEIPLPETGNVVPLLHEVRHALQRLLREGEETIIDLRALPLAPGEEERIVNALGEGEVRISLDALGRSEFNETQYSGVWLVTHYNRNDEIMGKFIEIAPVPALAKAPQESMAAGLNELEQTLSGDTPP